MNPKIIILSLACFGTLLAPVHSRPSVIETIMGASGDMSSVLADGSANQIGEVSRASGNVLTITANGSALTGQEAVNTGGGLLRSAVSTAGSMGMLAVRALGNIMAGSSMPSEVFLDERIDVPMEYTQNSAEQMEYRKNSVEHKSPLLTPARRRVPVAEEVLYQFVDTPRRHHF